jgi:hypothetical protein
MKGKHPKIRFHKLIHGMGPLSLELGVVTEKARTTPPTLNLPRGLCRISQVCSGVLAENSPALFHFVTERNDGGVL